MTGKSIHIRKIRPVLKKILYIVECDLDKMTDRPTCMLIYKNTQKHIRFRQDLVDKDIFSVVWDVYHLKK